MSDSEEDENFNAFNDDTFGDAASTWEEDSHEQLVAKATVECDQGHGRSPFPDKIEEDIMLLQKEMAHSMKMGLPPQQQHQPTMSLHNRQQNLPLLRSSPFDRMPPIHQRPPWMISAASHEQQQRFSTNQPPPQFAHSQLQHQGQGQPPQQTHQQFHHHNHRQHPSSQYHNQQHMQQQHNLYHRRSQQNHRYNNHNYHGNYNNHHHHQQQQQHHHHFNNARSDASHYNDRNRETFGDELFAPSPSNVLITPDRVHANRVLNNRRSEDSTGDPEMDMRRNVQYMMTQKENDEYSGLMTATDRQWVLQIQLSQLKCENPFVDDYYFTVYNQKKKLEAAAMCRKYQQSCSGGSGYDDNNDSQSMEKNLAQTQLKRTDEGPQLLISEYSAGDDSNSYTPVQFDNSLGKLQAASVKAPRMAIDIDCSNNDLHESLTSNAQKDSRKYKQTLLELEHLNQVESERVEALAELRKRLSVETNVRRYILVRKGKTLLKRILRHLEQGGVNCVISILFALLPSALRRDRDDQILPELLPQFEPLMVEQLKPSKDQEFVEIFNELSSALKDTPIIVPPVKGYFSIVNCDSDDDPGFYRMQLEKLFSVI
ncbi:PATL1 [Lepeophtheirus salmonis]|uniref:PATL1 n=1 Tax=Lepeophtheirus salmonis TaxID=72036 RepID=A0A7R8D5Y0_LEPSM|nr:PATL1 [Lepeophtheirus salmonis]CAF3039991.1 PATL1 [Lepeophtheirus salmonis]